MIGMLGYYKEIPELATNSELIRCLDQVIETLDFDPTKATKELYRPELTNEYTESRVSEAALRVLIDENPQKDHAQDDTNVYKFNHYEFRGANQAIAYLFTGYQGGIGVSGRIWYPKNGYMGWHTNQASQGYRLYCSYAPESKKSFFRFRDPTTNEIITSWDKEGWGFRMFHITQDAPVWHCVYSETNRISLGYNLDLKQTGH
jgi:hypothetical protein